MEIINFEGIRIEYNIVKKGTKNLYARMDENGVINLSIPYFVNKKIIEKFVIDSYLKLNKKKNKKKKCIIENDMVKILGINYEIKDIDNLDYLLTSKLKMYLKNNYLDICKRMNIDNIPSVMLKRVKGYLGQYNKRKHQITLNILITHLDEKCVEYVLIHELTHIKYMNHQQEFWKEVSVHCPDYKRLRNKCKKEFVYYENY